MSSNQLKVLDKFSKELEEFARVAECAGRPSDPAATPTKRGAHNSVRTIQEFLPYQQQFQEAGLAVTSAEQKAPLKIEQKVEQPIVPEEISPDQGSLTDTKEHKSDTVVQGPSKQNSSVRDVSPPNMERHPTEIMLASSPTSGSSYSASSPRLKGNRATENSSPRQTSPSVIFLANKPLPARPGSFGQRGPASPSKSLPVTQSISRIKNLNKPTAAQMGLLGSSPRTAPGQVRFSPGLQQNPVRQPTSMSNIPRARSSFQVARDPPEAATEKALPELPISRIPAHVQDGRTSLRQIPTPILEEKEPLLERRSSIQRDIPLHPKDNNAMVRTPSDETRRVSEDAKPTVSVLSSTPEPLPETWKHAPGTPSSFKQALDDVVRKLDDMEEDKDKTATTPIPSATVVVENSPRHASTSRQRLDRTAGAATRREKMWLVSGEHHDVEPEPVSTPVRNGRHVVRARSNRRPSVRIRRGGGGLASSTGQNGGGGGKSTTTAQAPKTTCTHDDSDISDGDVLQGLKIICAASADHDFDAWIQRQTGLRLRRFLADLKTFEYLAEGGGFAGNASAGIGVGLGEAKSNTQVQARRRKSERRRKLG